MKARVWYSEDDDDCTTQFDVPDLAGAGLLMRDFINGGWYRMRIYNDAGHISHIVRRNSRDCCTPVILEVIHDA